tara:strand:+ start:7185 stop:8342 length:1158 start_codon:yes stop_codon:yes gene_type:complete
MGVSRNNKYTWQEFQYIKIPDRRLISGLLYINVVNHDENDDSDDLIQECNDAGNVPDGIEYSDAFVDNSGDNDGFQNRGRRDMKHSFADYDCFVFHVAGGMSLTGGIQNPTTNFTNYNTLQSLKDANFVTAAGKWEDSGELVGDDYNKDWKTLNDSTMGNPYGDACSHFIKYHLLSRINNASGHGLNQTSQTLPLFYKSRPIHTQFYRNAGGVDNLADPAVVQNDYILSHGIYDDEDTQGTNLTAEHFAVPAEGGGAGFQRIESSVRTAGESQATNGDISNADGNTYYSPVDTIKIYGKHRLVFESHQNVALNRRIYSITSSNSAHEQNWWDLVIDIGLRGNNPQGNSAQSSASTKAILRPQINISFQPFGETADFDISDTEHTS